LRSRSRIVVDVTRTPNETTDTLPDGKEIKGIDKLDGDTLTSCVALPGKDRPTEFASKPGTGQTLRIFERVKPSTVPTKRPRPS
jgi:hypothetical protein